MKKVYIVVETYSGDTDGINYEIEKLEHISVFSSLKKAKEKLNKIYEKDKDLDALSITNNEGTYLISYYDFSFLENIEKPKTFSQLANLILKERQNGNFPNYHETYILTKELKGDN